MNKKTTLFSIIIPFFAINLKAQEIIKHVVKKGETVYQLSKLYNVDIDVIYRHNPTAETVIRVDETLSFPRQNDKTEKPEIENGYLIHWVSVGETKFGLSRRYNISIPQLEELNPQIVTMLQAGQKLKIPNNDNLIIIKPGETLYGISKRYGMTVDELTKLNSDRLQGVLKSGQYLYVGKNKETRIPEENKEPYIVKTGDTKTSLSKKFGVSIAELERLNPHIVPMLKVEDEIRLTETVKKPTESKPNEKTVERSEKKLLPTEEKTAEYIAEKPVQTKEAATESSSIKYIDYEIQPKETLFGLSKKAHITSEELVALNPQLNDGVQIGMVIKMPESSDLHTEIDQTDNTITKKHTETPIVPMSSDKLSATLVKNTEKTLYFITPFSESEFRDLNINTQGLDRPLKNQIDFLNGAQIAIEKAKSEGLKLKVQFLKSKEIETQKELQDKIKQEADAVILTSNRKEDSALIKEYSNLKTPIIVAQPETDFLNAENIFNSLPSIEFERKTILNYLKKQKGKVIVIQDEESSDLTKLINEYFPSAEYFTANAGGDIDSDELQKSLSSKSNFVILNTAKNSIILMTTTALLEKVATHKIQLVVLQNNKIPDSEQISQNRLKILKMIYPSLEIPSSKSNNFIEEYKYKNNQKPSNELLRGYDVTIDTALRLFQNKSFRETAETIKSEQLTTKFDYKKNESGSFSNYGISIMQYDEKGIVKISD